MATYIIALRPVFGRASGLVRVGPDGARFSLRGVSFGRAHLILQNGRTRSANIRPTPGGGTAFIPLRGREFPLGAAVTVRGVVVLIGTTGTRASDILEKARQLAADPEQRRAEEAAMADESEAYILEGSEEKATPEQRGAEESAVADEAEASILKEPEEQAAALNQQAAPPPAPPVEPVKPEAVAVSAAKEEPFVMPQPPMAKVEPENPPAKQHDAASLQQDILQKWQQTLATPEPEAKPPEAALNRKTVPDGPPKQPEVSAVVQPPPPPPVQSTAPESGDKDCAVCTETERGGMIASFMLENDQTPPAPPPEAPMTEPAKPPYQAAAANIANKEVDAFMEARTPHAFYQPILDDDPGDQLTWDNPAVSASEERRDRPMVGRRLGVFSNAFPGDWPRVNWQVFSHPGGTHLLRTRLDDKELYAIPARPSATPPAGIPATARYCVSRTGQGYWVF
ncbi:MAG: hypothetical protein ACOYI3_02560 [Christensenellales bacterium]|jgi:hypothetical protein